MNPLLRYPADIGPIPGKSIRQIEQEKPKEHEPVIVDIKPGLRTVNGKMETVDYAKPPEPVKSSALCEPQAAAEPVQAVPSEADVFDAYDKCGRRCGMDYLVVKKRVDLLMSYEINGSVPPKKRAACIAALDALKE